MKATRLTGLLLILLLTAPMLQAATLSVTADGNIVDGPIGSSVNVAISIAGLGDLSAPSLSVYDITLAFDSAVIDVSSIVFGDPVNGSQFDLAGSGTYTDSSTGSGSVNLAELSFATPTELDTL